MDRNSDPCFHLVASAGISPAIFCHIIAEGPVISHGQADLEAFRERLRRRNSSSSTTSSPKQKDPLHRTRWTSPFQNQKWYRDANNESASNTSTSSPPTETEPHSSPTSESGDCSRGNPEDPPSTGRYGDGWSKAKKRRQRSRATKSKVSMQGPGKKRGGAKIDKRASKKSKIYKGTNSDTVRQLKDQLAKTMAKLAKQKQRKKSQGKR